LRNAGNASASRFVRACSIDALKYLYAKESDALPGIFRSARKSETN